MISSQENSNYHFLKGILHTTILGASFWILSIPMTTRSGSVAALVGCFLASYLISSKRHRRIVESIKTRVLCGLSLGFLFFGALLSELFVTTKVIAISLSPILTFNLGEVIKWLAIGLSCGLFLRILTLRKIYGPILEILFVSAAVVWTLAAHRNGMIHRPFFIGDFAQIRGIDPSTILMAFGCAAVLTLSALLILEKNTRRLVYHFSSLIVLCFSLFIYVEFFGLPTPQTTDSLGLTGRESGTNSQRENPFRDGENENNDKEAPVAVVVFRDDYDPLNGSYYFRESAYSQFNGIMLDYSEIDGMDSDLIKQFPVGRVETSDPPPNEEQHKLIRTTVGMLVPHKNPLGLESPTAYQNMANPNNLRFKKTYDAFSLAPQYDLEYLLDRETGNDGWSQEVSAEYLKIPDDDRYQTLATELLTDLKPEFRNDPFAKAWTIKTYLDENGIYSLKNQHAYEPDPAASFLFGDLTGYCMHFSFAATYLFRSVGIPARVGIGYSVPASNRAGGSALLVQAIHGHAWPEVYFKDIGWVIIDPAPQQTLVDMTTDPQDSLQQMLGDMLRNDESFQEFLDSQKKPYLNAAMLMNILYLLITAGLVLGYAIKIYRLLIPTLIASEDSYRLRFRAILDRLGSIGVYRQFGESRERFASRAYKIAPSLTEITDSHLAYALGDGNQAKTSGKEWQEFEKKIKQEIKYNTHKYRQILALVNPFSWLYTK